MSALVNAAAGTGKTSELVARFITEDLCLDTVVITRRSVERIARKALAIARQRTGAPADGRRLTGVDKAKVLRGLAFFRDGVRRVAVP